MRIITALLAVVGAAALREVPTFTVSIPAALEASITSGGAAAMGLIPRDVLVISAIEAGSAQEAAVAVRQPVEGDTRTVIAAAPTADMRAAWDGAATLGLVADVLVRLPFLVLAPPPLLLGAGSGGVQDHASGRQPDEASEHRATRLNQRPDKGIELAVIHGKLLLGSIWHAIATVGIPV